MNKTLTILAFSVAAAILVIAHGTTFADQGYPRKQYVYVLHLTQRLHDTRAWTDAESGVIAKHFSRLAKAARLFMETDPAVVANNMTATLHPYAVAL